MRPSRFLLMTLSCAYVASAQNPPKSSIENRGNAGVNTPDPSGKPKTKLSKADSQFLRDALNSGRSENDKARLALSQGSNVKVRDFAKILLDDHSAESKELVAIAARDGFSELLSLTGDYFDARVKVDARTGEKRSPAKNDLSLLHGAAFDKEFAKQLPQDIQARISKFEAAQRDVSNADLREFASSTLPKLREHLTQAQALDK